MDAFKAALNITHEPSRQRAHIETAAAIGKRYFDAMKSATDEVVYTPEGRTKLARRHAAPALSELADLLVKVGMTLQQELRAAVDATVSAMNKFAVPYSVEPWNAAFDAEIARAIRGDAAIRGMLVNAAQNGVELDPAYHDYLRAAIRAPRVLTGFTVAEQNAVVGLLTGGNLNAVPFEGWRDARLMIKGTVTRIINDVPIRFGELVQMHRPLAELVSGADAIGTEQPDAPNAENFAAVSSTPPLVTGDRVHDGYSEDAEA